MPPPRPSSRRRQFRCPLQVRIHPDEQVQRQRLVPNIRRHRWTGNCWYVYNLLKYEFDLQFNIPITYPTTASEIELPQLDGKTQKRGEDLLDSAFQAALGQELISKSAVNSALNLL
ncbi:unnamed protein product [Malus baccata var. baccata]